MFLILHRGDKKRTEAGIHWPHRVDASWHATGCNRNREADPSDRPQKIEKSCFGSELLHHVHTMACSGGWPLIDYLVSNDNGIMEAASPCSWPNNFSCHLPVFAADLVVNEDSPAFAAGFSDDSKLGYGFTSADYLEEVDIGPGDKPRPTFISKKLDPVLREEMIALLKEYRDCFAWDYTEMPGLDRSIIEHRLPLKKGFRPFQQRARQMKAEVLEEV